MEFASSALHVRRRFLPTPNPTFSAGAITTFLRVPTRSNLIIFALSTDQFPAGVKFNISLPDYRLKCDSIISTGKLRFEKRDRIYSELLLSGITSAHRV